MTDMETAAGEGLRRRRGGGREGHARNALPQQPPWAQPRMRYRPTEVVSADELEVDPHRLAPRPVRDRHGLPRRGGARGPAGGRRRPSSPATQRVRFDPDMVTERHPDRARRRSPCTPGTRSTTCELGGDWMAFGTVGSPPNVADLDRGRRIGNRDDYQNLLRLGQSLNSVHFLAGYPVEPVDIHHGVRHLARDLRRADADGQADPRLQPRSPAEHRHASRWSGSRAASTTRQLDREPSIFTVVNSSSPLRLDAPMLQGIIEFSARNQVVCITPFTLAGRDGAGDAGRRARRAERRGAGRAWS